MAWSIQDRGLHGEYFGADGYDPSMISKPRPAVLARIRVFITGEAYGGEGGRLFRAFQGVFGAEEERILKNV